ncbi:hypothetical protein [Actinoplanes flavus]|uniref:Uncharacterized protein n=1 Tax=Actinoplanes flavus TaxID=2820290 RepID=A0ABS3UU46_9ACTN|nr:hypothetical protein [Actinoplanes flavus]MBO3742072.1 hypothetical protein [Actinoplanes flavus]
MEARHDLGKFITELSVAQRGVVLSSGRGVSGELMIAQGGVMVSTRSVPSHRRGSVDRNNRRNDNVVRLTPEAGIETSTRMGSDQKAAEALQEAETEVVIARKVDWVRVSGWPSRRSMSALRPES